MIERIKKLLSCKAKSVREFAGIIGVKQVTLNQQISGSRSLSLDVVIAILNSFEEISAEWLLRGKGDMMLKDNCESALCNEENEDMQSLRDKIISLEAENKVLRELLGLRNDINKEGIA